MSTEENKDNRKSAWKNGSKSVLNDSCRSVKLSHREREFLDRWIDGDRLYGNDEDRSIDNLRTKKIRRVEFGEAKKL